MNLVRWPLSIRQTLENKQRFISQIMTSKSPVRSCDDVDEKHHEPEMEETPDEESARPSVLAALNEKSDKEEPVKPFRSYSDRDGDAR